MSYRYTAAVLGLAAGLAAGACSVEISGDDTVVREERRFTVSGEPDLQIETFDGSVQIRSWDRADVLVQIEKHGRDRQQAAALPVTVVQERDRIRVQAQEPPGGSGGIRLGGGRSVSFIISVPHTGRVYVRSGDGSINVDNVAGRIELHSQDGSIRAVRIAGDLVAETGDGSVHVDGQLALLRTTTRDGSISIEAAAGSQPKADWEVSSGDGSITIALPSAFDADVEARTGDGSISIAGLADSGGDSDRRSLSRRLGRGGHTLKVQSGDGSIRISTP